MYSRSLLTLVLFSVLFATVPCGTTPARAQEGEGAEQQPAADTEKQAKSSDKLFPDPALEAAVRKEVFAKRYNDEPLTKEDVKDVSQVVAIGKGIENLEGLQHLVSLRLIRLTDNKVKDLAPLAELKLLQSIDLAKNQISDIAPLADLTRVQLLELSGNQIERIDAIKNMDNMRTLWLADNQIESLEPIAGLGKIGSLDLAGNGLKDDDLAPLGKLSCGSLACCCSKRTSSNSSMPWSRCAAGTSRARNVSLPTYGSTCGGIH
jgi:hypothetical protein